jgi:hypothetical protein
MGMRFGRKGKLFALLGAVAVSAGLVVVGTAAHGASYTFLDVQSSLSPDTVPSGGSVLWQITVFDPSEGGASVQGVTAAFSIGQGSFDLTATNNFNGSSACKKVTPPPGDLAAAAAARNVSCKLGDMNAGDSKSIGVVVNTTGVAAGSTIFGNVFVQDKTGQSTGSDSVQIHVILANPDSKTSFVAPGGTISVGPKTPDAEDPTVGSFTLPKKINPMTTSTKLVPGPGGVITISIADPATEPTACGGQQCHGKIINVSDFAGYNDKKHPALFKLLWAPNVLGPNSVLYIIKGSPASGIAIPSCIKVKGEYTNTPCIAKHSENKKTHKITDTVALLSGDPGGARK